jgi:hypothetical protein
MKLLKCEALLIALAFIVAFTAPTVGGRWFEKCERIVARIAERQGLRIVLVLVIAVALRPAKLPISPVPEPMVQDEFGYALLFLQHLPDRSFRFPLYFAIAVGYGVVMAKLIEAPAFAIRDRLFPSRSAISGRSQDRSSDAVSSERTGVPYTVAEGKI